MSQFLVQSKNGTRTGWRDEKPFDDLIKAIQCCEQLKSNNRRKPGTDWYSTRVATMVDGKLTRVYPAFRRILR